MKFKNLFFIIIAITVIGLTSCVKDEFEAPPDECIDTVLFENTTIQELKDMFVCEETTQFKDTMKITDDLILKVTVISSDKTGNFYKKLVVQDETGGIALQIAKTNMYTSYPFGQILYIKCQGLYIGRSGGIPTLGSLYEEDGLINFGRIQGNIVIDNHIIPTWQNKPIEPTIVTIKELISNEKYFNTLIKIEDAQFKSTEIGNTYADPKPDEPQDENHAIFDKTYEEIVLRSSGYSSFAGDLLPEGNGSITAIFAKYNTDLQLTINNTENINFTKERLPDPIYKDFKDGDLYSGGWTNQTVIGTANWTFCGYGYDDDYAIQCTNYSNGNTESETWYISPALNLTIFENPVLRFFNASNYDGPQLEVKYSINYDGESSPNTATWTNLSPNLSNSDFEWVSSGELNLSSNENVYVGFIYKGTDSDGRTWEVDNIEIRGKSTD